jgi:hypothetical protein
LCYEQAVYWQDLYDVRAVSRIPQRPSASRGRGSCSALAHLGRGRWPVPVAGRVAVCAARAVSGLRAEAES